ncbi:MAG TPA: c-type cytochrome [Anaerolineales bacterium]|jgi:cytochrome c2
MRIRIDVFVPILAAAGLMLAGCGGGQGDPLAGRALYHQETIGNRQAPGCVTCHLLVDGEVKVGPPHYGIAERAEARVRAQDYRGQANSAAEYLEESIRQPNAYVVEGYQPGVMYGQYEEVLTDKQIDDLVAFLLTLH